MMPYSLFQNLPIRLSHPLQRHRRCPKLLAMYSCPSVTVTKHHKYSCWKHTFILLKLWRSKVQNPFHRAKAKVLVGLAPCGGSQGRICILAFFSFCNHLFFLTQGFFLRLQSPLLPSVLLSSRRLLL